MRKILIIGFKLTAICMVASLALGFVNVVTRPHIEENKRLALQRALALVNEVGTPGEEVIIADTGVVRSYYPVFLDDGTLSSFILRVVGVGYSGDLVLLANFEPSGRLIRAFMLAHTETPGIGDQPERPEFYNKFIGRGDADNPIPTRRTHLSRADSDSVAGATITFVGVANALADGAAFVRNVLAKDPNYAKDIGE
ncbi:MAG: FMN-binding protein [Spirochaetes bacterium]|nr:FMN-binding protein [Spirochaetota bacterium]